MLKLHQVLKSSRAAIDLASIMVGIIVIGLIGGVIAATVFAVIPWAQNNAAKQQLDSVVSAESSYRGLSADKDTALQNAAATPTSITDPNQVVLNSTFTGSAGLAKNNLLSLNASGLYCVIATTDGKDYHAYSKSGSGQWYYATSGKTQPTEYTGSTPCLTTGATAGTVDTAIDDGSGAVPTTPATGGGATTTTPTPTPTPTSPTTLAYFEFAGINGWTSTNGSTLSQQSTYNHSGSAGTSLQIVNAANSRASSTTLYADNTTKPFTIQEGKQYRVTAWFFQTTPVSPRIIVDGQKSNTIPTTATSTWQQVTFTFTGTSTGAHYPITFQTDSSNGYAFCIDDVKIEQLP